MHLFNSCSELLVYIELCFHTINNSYSHSRNDFHTLTKKKNNTSFKAAYRLRQTKKRDCPSCLWVANIIAWILTYSANTKEGERS